MKKLFLSVCLLISFFVPHVIAAEESSTGFSFYSEYIKIASESDSISDIAPYMPDWWRSRYESADQATQTSALERLRKAARDIKDVTYEKEEAVENGVRLYMTATEQHGFPMKGEVLLLKVSGTFTVEESKWATKQ